MVALRLRPGTLAPPAARQARARRATPRAARADGGWHWGPAGGLTA
jgi:hypothetical protein